MTETTYTTDQIRAEVKNLVARVTEREPDEIPDDAHFMDQLGVDSLMAMEIMIAVDRKFGIDIPEEEFGKATNVNESVKMVQYWLGQRATAAASS
jgi:acyl carrier protein